MNKLRRILSKPSGQVLLATLLFCFIFTALFVGLYHAGMAYRFKEKSRVGADLTALSGGAVYANGLQLVRYSNAFVMMLFAVDVGAMGMAMSPFVPTFPEGIPAAVAAAKSADPKLREVGHRAQKYVFGIDLPPGLPVGAYPALIETEAHFLAKDNLLKNGFISPLFFYNYESTRGFGNALLPDMALRFRKADELIPEPRGALYSLLRKGERHYFTEDQVESARNPRHPREKRVRRDLPSPYAGMWVRREKGSAEGESGELGHLGFLGPMVWKALRDLLKDIVLDVTHRDDPPCHSLALVGQLPGRVTGKQVDFTQVSEVVLEGGGLAAWNVLDPPFQVHLQKVEPGDLIGLRRNGTVSLPFPPRDWEGRL